MPDIIIIRGEAHAGKSTTARYLYDDMITLGATPISLVDDLHGDIIATVHYKGKTVVIISKGDVWNDLEPKIDALPAYDVLVVCARTRNSITFSSLQTKFGNQIILVENIVKQANNSKALKQGYINSIIAKI